MVRHRPEAVLLIRQRLGRVALKQPLFVLLLQLLILLRPAPVNSHCYQDG